jgi:autotransporter-associated beta strand protein
MKKGTYLSLMTLASGVWIGTSAQAQYTYFSDNFDNKVNPLDPPQVGYGYTDTGTTGSPFSLSTNPALGTQSLEIQRSGTTQGTIQVIGLNGALVDGNTVTFSWDEYVAYLYNAPVQVSLGYSPYSTGSLDFVGINDNPGGHAGTYIFYTDQDGDEISTGVKPTVDGWDHLTVVMNLSEYYVAGGPNYMTGTMDMYVAQNGGPEDEVASNVALPYAQIPTQDPLSPYDNSSDAGMQIQEGSSANTYYDNLLITGTDAPAPPLPEPPLTWNNTGGSGNGVTWDYGNNQNWNNGSGAAVYVDNSDITFNDQNNGNYGVNLVTTVDPESITFDNNSAAYTISGTGSIIGAGSLTMSGTNTVFLNNTGSNTYTGGTNVTSGMLVIGAAGALPAGYGMSITGGTLQLAANTGGETLSSLSVSAGGFLDVGNNHIVISDLGGSIDTTIRGYLANGYNNGNWNGTSGAATGGGIGTSSATGTKYGIGYADGADGGIGGISSGQLEVKYTLYGDANLDGSVNSIDFGDMAANFGKSGKVWDQGDFNYDGTVNSIDFGLLAGNFGKSVGGNADVTSADWAALDAFAAANGLMADVPEPASASLILFTGLGVLTRRRRRKND